MEADEVIHSQAPGRALGVPLKRGRKDYMNKGREGKIMTGNPTETTDQSQSRVPRLLTDSWGTFLELK